MSINDKIEAQNALDEVEDETTGDTDDFPRGEAARLVSASLRPSLFLFIDGGDLREYSTRFPDTVPVVHPTYYSDLLYQLESLLPNGGVICVPPPDHLLCTRCRIGVRTHVTADDQELCDSCAMGFQQATGIAPKPIANSVDDPHVEGTTP